MIQMVTATIDRKVRAIVQFGPATATSGMVAGTYYQVTIDPNMASPNGEYIRFGFYQGDELVGWQRIEAMTVCEVLGDGAELMQSIDGYQEESGAEVNMRQIVKE